MSTIIDLPTAKSYLMVSHAQQDAVIQIMADAAESFLSSYLGITFGSVAVQEDLHGGMAILQPITRPVTSLTVQAGQTFPTVLDRSTNDLIVVSLVKGSMIVRADPDTGVPWLQPTIYDISMQQNRFGYWTRFMDGIARYRANYTAGYASNAVPPMLKQAALQMVYRAYHARAAQMSDGAKGASMQFGEFFTSDIARMIKPYSLKPRASV